MCVLTPDDLDPSRVLPRNPCEHERARPSDCAHKPYAGLFPNARYSGGGPR